jgi:hypothetical protein
MLRGSNFSIKTFSGGLFGEYYLHLRLRGKLVFSLFSGSHYIWIRVIWVKIVTYHHSGIIKICLNHLKDPQKWHMGTFWTTMRLGRLSFRRHHVKIELRCFGGMGFQRGNRVCGGCLTNFTMLQNKWFHLQMSKSHARAKSMSLIWLDGERMPPKAFIREVVERLSCLNFNVGDKWKWDKLVVGN